MPITPVNKAKNTITPSSVNKSGYVLWDDNLFTWDSAIALWDSPTASFVNKAKNTITPINKVKN